MKVKCQSCGARFKLEDSKIPEQGLSMKCPKCSSPIMVEKQGGDPFVPDPVDELPPEAPEETTEEEAPEFSSDMDLSGGEDFADTDLDLSEPGHVVSDDDSLELPDVDAQADEDAVLPGLDTEFSIDDALADLDDEMELDEQDSIPNIPEDDTKPIESGEEIPEMSLDESSDELPQDIESLFDDSDDEQEVDAPGSGEDLSLDMPLLMDNKVPEDSEALPELDGGLDDLGLDEPGEEEGFSFDDMVEQDAESLNLDEGEDLEALPTEELPQEEANEGDLLTQLPDLEGGDAKVTMYQIKRPNGKTFGPFPVETVLDMITSGKLQGNEEISEVGGEWKPIKEVEIFKEAAANLSGDGEGLDALIPDDEKPKSELDKERKKILEESKKRRRAGSLDVVTPMKKSQMKISPKVAIPVVLGVILAIVFGYFQFVQEVSIIDVVLNRDISDKPLYKQLKSRYRKQYDEAQLEIKRDNYQGYTKAREICLNMLKVPDFRGNKIVWALLAQVDYQILRRFAVSKELSDEAKDALAKLDKLKREDREILFAKATKTMYEKNFVEAKDILLKALMSQHDNVQALHLIAEAFLFLPDKKPAENYLEKVISSNKATARTFYLQGLLYDQLNQPVKSQKSFAKALEKDPEHLDSQIELAGILLKTDGGNAKAERELHTIRNTFKDRMSKKQLARVHYYSAQIFKAYNEPYKVVKELAAAIDSEKDNYLYNKMLGAFYTEKHEFEKAKEQYILCIKNNPQAIECRLALGETLLTLNHPDQALFKLEEALKIAPKNADVHYLLGQSLEKLFQPDKGLEKYEQAISLNPNGVNYYTSAAMLYLKQDNLTKAGEYIQKAKLIQSNSPLVYNFLGRMHLHQGDEGKAEEEFAKAIKVDPGYIEAHYHLANTHRNAGKFDKAIKQYEEVLNLDDRSDAAYYGLGRTYFLKGEIDKAITEYEKALNLNPRDHEYFHYAGTAYYSKGNMEKAKDSFLKALDLKPDFAKSAFYLGRVFMDQEKWDKAMERIEQAIQIEKSNPEYIFYLGWLFEKQEKYQDAIDFYDRTLSMKKDYAEVYLRKGVTLRAQNKFKPAIKMFLKAQKHDTSISMARIELGDCYFEMRLHEKAIKQYKEAIKAEPENAKAYLKLGLVYQELAKNKKAIQYLKKAAQFDPNDPKPHLGLGYAYKAIRKRSDSIKEFEIYLDLNPEAIDREDIEDEIYYQKSKKRRKR